MKLSIPALFFSILFISAVPVNQQKTSLLLSDFHVCDTNKVIRLNDYDGLYLYSSNELNGLGDYNFKLTNEGKKYLKEIAPSITKLAIVNPTSYTGLIDYKLFTNLDTLVYMGDDFDYYFNAIPSAALRLPRLKTIYIDALDSGLKIEPQVKLIRPNIVVIRQESIGTMRICDLLK